MKIVLRLPAKEQYAYLEYTLEGPDTPEFADSAIDEYSRLTKAIRGGSGLPDSEFNDWSQRYLNRETMTSEDLERYQYMSEDQKSKVQWAKRSFKRIKK